MSLSGKNLRFQPFRHEVPQSVLRQSPPASAAFAQNNFRSGQFGRAPFRLPGGELQSTDQQPFRQIVIRKLNGGQRRVDITAERKIIKAHNRHLFREGPAVFRSGDDQTHRLHVVFADHRQVAAERFPFLQNAAEPAGIVVDELIQNRQMVRRFHKLPIITVFILARPAECAAPEVRVA